MKPVRDRYRAWFDRPFLGPATSGVLAFVGLMAFGHGRDFQSPEKIALVGSVTMIAVGILYSARLKLVGLDPGPPKRPLTVGRWVMMIVLNVVVIAGTFALIVLPGRAR